MGSNDTRVPPCGDLARRCRPVSTEYRVPSTEFILLLRRRASEQEVGRRYAGPDPKKLVCRYAGRLLAIAAHRLDELDIQAKRLQLADEDVERFRHARLDRRLALDDGLVDLGAAVYVVGLGGEQLLQDVSRAVGFEGPHFHFAEALTAELRLAAQRLLGDERVRTDGTRVNLVVHQVVQFQHIDVADGDLTIERLAGGAVMQRHLAG